MDFLGIEIPDYGMAIIIMGAFLILAQVFLYLMKAYLGKYARATATALDDDLVNALRIPGSLTLLFMGFDLSFPYLQAYIDPTLADLILKVDDAILIGLFGFVFYRAFNVIIQWYGTFVAKRTATRIDDIIIPIIRRFGKLLIAAIIFIIVLYMFNVDITAPIAGLGLAGLSVSLAAQDTIANFIASVFLFTDRPFGEGDTIQLPTGEVCEVIEIGVRRTKLFDVNSNNYIVVTNSDLAKWKITNLTLPTRKLRMSIPISVEAHQDLEKIKELVLKVASGSPHVAKDPQPQILCTGLSALAMKLELIVYIDDFHDRLITMDEIYSEVKRVFAKESIRLI